jgi:23S rRNA pseudouridine1911/1915/1917 synthase
LKPSDGSNNLFAARYRHLERKGVAEPYAALHHRLDRETSGVMVFALDRTANRNLGNAFMQRLSEKVYLAWVAGRPKQAEWVARDDIGRKGGRYTVVPPGQGKPAETAFQVVHGEPAGTLLLAHPLTGRTHQIRLHLAAAGLSIMGDRLYGGKPANRLYLHAHRLTLPHPHTRKELILTAPVPPDWPPPRCITIPDRWHN